MSSPARWLIWSNEHRAWWRPNKCGYTQVAMDAGLYEQADAEEICRQANYRTGGKALREAWEPPEVMVPDSFLQTMHDREGEKVAKS